MADRQEKLGIVVYVEDQASGKLTKVKAEVAAMGPAGAAAGRGLATGASSIERSAGRIGGALSHAKGAIGGLLSGPLGILGLGAGLFTLAGGFEAGLSKAQTWGLQIEKLQGITHDSAESLSGLLAVTEKYGLSNERLSQIAGFTEKALGNLEKGITDEGLALAGTTGPSDAVLKAQERLRVATIRLNEVEGKRKVSLSSLVSAQNSVKDAQRALDKALGEGGASVGGADKFLKDYGFDIRDAKGNVKDFSTLLLTFSDYWNGNTAQGLKAAAAAKLFGRGYADLVPILNLGSKGIQQAEEEAKALGLTLTQDNIVALSKAREATRQWGDALGGLELQLGIALLPQLTKLASWATSFVSTHGHEIVKFFTDAADFAGQAAGTIADMAGAAASFWNTIPPELRDLMLKGIVADRTIHFLFGFSPLEAAGGGILKALTGNIFSRGSTPANPLFVADVTGGAGGLIAGAAGVGLLTVGLTAAAIAGIGLAFYAAMQQNPRDDPGYRPGQVITPGRGFGPPSGHGTRTDIYGHAPTPTGPFHDSAETRALQGTAQALIDQRASERSDWVASMEATRALTGVMREAPWLSKLEDSWRKAGQTMHDKIKAAIAGLSGPHAGAAAAFLGSKLGNAGFGAGGYNQALAVLAQLKAMKQSPDVVTAIHQLEGRLKRLKIDRDDLAAAEKIATSADPKNRKLDELNRIMADLRTHGDRTTRAKVQDLINAVKHQKLHTTVNITTKVDAYVRTGVSTKAGATSVVSRYSNARYEYAEGGAYGPGVRLVGERGPELDVSTGSGSGYIFNAAQTRALAAAIGHSGGNAAHALGGLGRASGAQPVAVTVNNRISPVGLHRATTTHRIYNAGAGEAIRV